MSSPSPSLKKRRVSKKRKSSWRKHSSKKEVEEYLENKRLDDRTGGPISEKDDEEIFFFGKEATKEEVPDRRSRRQSRSAECHSSIHSLDSHIKPIKSSRAPKENPKAKLFELKYKDPLDVDDGGEMKFYDIWHKKDDSGFPEGDVFVHSRRVCRKMPIKPPRNFGKKSSAAGAIPLPHPGISYNPSFQDHQKVLSDVLEAELKKEKEERRIYNATDAMFPTKDEMPTQETWLEEMSQGLGGIMPGRSNDDEDDDDDDEKEGNRIGISHNAPVRRDNKKTERERKKMMKVRVAEKELRRKKKMEALEKSEKFKLKSLKKQLHRQEMERAARKTRKEWMNEKRMMTRPRKLGKSRFVEPQPPIKLTDELEGSLRLLKLQYLIFIYLKWCRKPKRYRPKVFEKSSYKDVDK
ncbi:hypothetical protein HELRODRAFT_195124 [Helobdella robusta]|uniref:Ribosome biogenesis protein NOP53 n=1 Tax=Helobdella robusta TaxID=6412 RepID=T1FWS1_HELRO|nr:hypothetical protein HELRODRAFT_195124 [Helobdella robusta]ESO00324.1 hypothetical protein HELRODRAFT_195124 [Helobdella robusta]